jgi:FG-GAP repeat
MSHLLALPLAFGLVLPGVPHQAVNLTINHMPPIAPRGARLSDRAQRRADFNGDGFTDLAIGAPFEDVETIKDAGGVNVIYGGPDGLDALAGPGNQLWSQDSPDIQDSSEMGDQFAFRIGSGDFNADGYADLVIGVPSETLVDISKAGALNIIYGGPSGLDASAGPGNQFWNQDSPDILDQAEPEDLFGRSAFGADFNDDGFDDLAVGAMTESVNDVAEAGAVNVIYGGPNGLEALAGPGNQFWNQDSPDVLDVAESKDHFGRAVSAADFNGDGDADLLIGDSDEKIGVVRAAGAVNVLYGSPEGLISTGNQFWNQDSPDIQDEADSGDKFGRVVSVGDFNADGWADAVFGVPGEHVGAIMECGSAAVIYGGVSGLDALSGPGNQLWSQDSPDIEDAAETDDRMGWDVRGG